MTNRYYFKCTYCERPFTVEYNEPSELQLIIDSACPLCNEKDVVRRMGRVEKTNIVRDVVKSACDLRCTNAVGPKCDCICVNHNHGTHRLVIFNKVVGKLEVVNADMLNDNENYLARIKRMAEAKNRIKVKVVTFLQFKFKDAIVEYNKGTYIGWGKAYQDYTKYREFMRRIDKLEDLKSIQRKVNTLAGMIPKIGTNLEYFEAIYEKKNEKAVLS